MKPDLLNSNIYQTDIELHLLIQLVRKNQVAVELPLRSQKSLQDRENQLDKVVLMLNCHQLLYSNNRLDI